MAGRFWGTLEEQQLAAWRAEGVKVRECARRLGRGRYSVLHKCRELGLPQRCYRYDVGIRHWHSQGLSMLAIASRLGSHYATVQHAHRRLGLVPNGLLSHADRMRANMQSFRRRHGQSVTEFLLERERHAVAADGWPVCVQRFAAAALAVLYDRGPMTVNAFMAATGRRCRKVVWRRLRSLHQAGHVVAVKLPSGELRYDLAPDVRLRRLQHLNLSSAAVPA